jgi:hypothetical protein
LTKGDAIAPFGNPTIKFPPQEAGLALNLSKWLEYTVALETFAVVGL